MSYAPGEQNESQRDVLKLTNHKENPKCLKQATKEEGSRRNTCDMLPMAAASESGDQIRPGFAESFSIMEGILSYR